MIGGASSGRRSTSGTWRRFSLTWHVQYIERHYFRNIAYIAGPHSFLLQATGVGDDEGLDIFVCGGQLVSSPEDNDLALTAMRFLLLLLCLAVRPVGLLVHSARVGATTASALGQAQSKKD
jgi:hypothetical protein